jgi:hypothetical protein
VAGINSESPRLAGKAPPRAGGRRGRRLSLPLNAVSSLTLFRPADIVTITS